MSIPKKTRAAANPLVETRDVAALKNQTGNLYESIAVMSRRANQISTAVQQDLHKKLEEFSLISESMEEVNENKEQIEISRIYERMANPAIMAIGEFTSGEIFYKKKEKEA